jgi:hypothetical protein
VANVTTRTTPTVAERNERGRSSGSQERDFGHRERVRASNNRDELG